jgi:hypothetical protein
LCTIPPLVSFWLAGRRRRPQFKMFPSPVSVRNSLKDKYQLKNSTCTAKKTQRPSITKVNWSTLFSEIIRHKYILWAKRRIAK